MNHTFGSDRGSVVVSSLVGMVIAAVTITAFATTMQSANAATGWAATSIARTSLLNSIANDLATQPMTVPLSPAVRHETLGSASIDVTVWRSDVDPHHVTIHAATPKTAGADCMQADDDCARAAVTVPTTRLGITPTPLTGSWSGSAAASAGGAGFSADAALGAADIPTGADEIRYVVHVTAPQTTALVFMDGTDALLSVPVPAGADGNFYGSINPDGATALTIALAGPGAAVSHLFLYEAPA